MDKVLSTYRKDIDGLRFIAVLAVVINHLNNKILPMGYLGVDIFFVISGYVISMSILNSKVISLKSFLISFFNKRVKRILPALIFYVLITGILTSFVVPIPGPSLKTGIFSMVGISNFFLYSQSIDYFASESYLNTFTNTWSLSVEEQLTQVLVWGNASNLNGLISLLHLIHLSIFIIFFPLQSKMIH